MACDFLIGEKDIKSRFGLGDKVYNTLVSLGMCQRRRENDVFSAV